MLRLFIKHVRRSHAIIRPEVFWTKDHWEDMLRYARHLHKNGWKASEITIIKKKRTQKKA